jgi:GT2 family glycosyltransferase
MNHKDLSKSLSEMDVAPRQVAADLTVIIPTLGREILESCLRSIVAGNAWPAHLIVVDQGSSPIVAAWIEILKTFGIQAEHVPSAQQGISSAVNRGLERVCTPFVVRTDDDCIVDPTWLQAMALRLRKTPDAVIIGRAIPEGNGPAVVDVTSPSPVVYHRPHLKFDPIVGCNMGTSMSVIEHVGFFDEDLRVSSAEDCEWSYRALRSGVSIIYAPEVVLRHLNWRSGHQRADRYKVYARSHGTWYGKYLRRGDWFIGLRVVVHFLRAVRWWLGGIIKGDRDRSLNGWAYLTKMPGGIFSGLHGHDSS